MKIGFLQFQPVLGDADANRRRLRAWGPALAEADLVVLPELCNSGYHFASRDQARSLAEDAERGPFVQLLLELAQQHDVHLVAGVNEWDAEAGCCYNTAVLIGPGGWIGKYRKLHLFMREREFFAPGDAGLPVFDMGIARIGLLICFDWIFPEAWRVLALRGADIICHPSNLVLPGLAQRATPVHAVTNRVYVITANRVGSEGELTFTGLSTIASPRAEVLLQADATSEHLGLVDADIALARDKQVTPMNHVLHDRRPECYTDLVGETGSCRGR